MYLGTWSNRLWVGWGRDVVVRHQVGEMRRGIDIGPMKAGWKGVVADASGTERE
jgi:hypothetical protein